MRCKWMQNIAWVKDFVHSLEYQHIVNGASALHISTRKRFLKGGHHDVHFWFHIHYQQVFRNKVDDPKFRCYLTLASERGHENWNGKGATKSCARVFLSLGSVSLEWSNGKKRNSFSIHPFGLACFIAAWERPPYPDAVIHFLLLHHLGANYLFVFARSLIAWCPWVWLFFESFLVGWFKVRPRHWYQERGLDVSFTKAAVTSRTCHFLTFFLYICNQEKTSECIQLLEMASISCYLFMTFWGEDLLHDDEHQWFRGQRWISWCDVWWVTSRSRISGSGKWWEMLAAEFLKVCFRRFQEFWWNNGAISYIIVQELCLEIQPRWSFSSMEGIFFRLVKYNDSIHPDQFRQKFHHEKPSGTSGRRHQAFGSCLCEDEGICQLGRNWIFVWYMFQGLKLKCNNSFLVIEIWIAILRFFSHSTWYLSSSCWMLIAIDGYHEATSLDLQSLGYETKCLGWKRGDMGLMGLMGGGYGGLVVLWLW